MLILWYILYWSPHRFIQLCFELIIPENGHVLNWSSLKMAKCWTGQITTPKCLEYGSCGRKYGYVFFKENNSLKNYHRIPFFQNDQFGTWQICHIKCSRALKSEDMTSYMEKKMAKIILKLCFIFEFWHLDNFLRWPVLYSKFFPYSKKFHTNSHKTHPVDPMGHETSMPLQ